MKEKYIVIISISMITLLSLFLKINQTDFNEPVFIDGAEYNQFAWNMAHGIRPLPVIHNLGFSLILTPIFLLIHNESSTELIQQMITISVSTATLPVFYLLARRLFSWKYALLSTSFMAFEPHMIQNATFGITESQYIFLFVVSLYLITSKRHILQYMSFLTAGLATITRFEGFILVAVMIIVYSYQNKKTLRNIVKIGLFITIFSVPVIMSTTFNLDYGTRENVITAKIIHDTTFTNTIITHHYFIHNLMNSILHFGWSLYPMFIMMMPIGIYFLFKNKPVNPILTMIVIGMLSFSGLFAYLRASDTRYFIPVYPAVALLSTYAIFCLVKSEKIRKLIRDFLEEKSDTPIIMIAFCAMLLLSLYVITHPASAEPIHVNLNNTIVIYPTFTLAAYDSNGFYQYYKGLCNERCLSISDKFSDITKIKYDAYGLDTLKLLKIPMISDEALDSDPNILKKYHTVIILHNEYVTKKEFNAIINHTHVIYLYPNALYAEVKRTGFNTITLIRGHNYPTTNITNGFGWKFDNSQFEYDKSCKNIQLLLSKISNGYMLNCYPETMINKQNLWNLVQNVANNK